MQENAQRAKNKDIQWLALVRQQVESLRYGVVQIVVHDARVTRIERTEKLRLEPDGKTAATSTEISGDGKENNEL